MWNSRFLRSATEGGKAYLGCEAFPGVERLVRGVHSLLGLGRSAVRHPGDLRAGGRVQHGEVGGRGHPAAAHVALRAEQRSRHVQGVAAVHGGGQPGQDEPEEAAGPRHTEGGHTGKRRLDLRGGGGGVSPYASGRLRPARWSRDSEQTQAESASRSTSAAQP